MGGEPVSGRGRVWRWKEVCLAGSSVSVDLAGAWAECGVSVALCVLQ